MSAPGPAAPSPRAAGRTILALAGGVGGAKLAHGLQLLMPPRTVVTVVNTGDDFDHLGLRVCPDLDTVMYTLSGLANPVTGWGVAGETWQFIDALGRLGGETWFRLGDRDLATHIERTRRLRAGGTLSSVTDQLCARLGVPTRVVPMSDDRVSTRARTDEGELPFQEYFVRRGCEPVVEALRYVGADRAVPSPVFDALLRDDALAVIVICPSNPYLSVAPILSIPEVRERLQRHPAPVVAVSPIVGGAAVKGPAAKLMREFGIVPSAAAVADYYAGLIDGFVLDTVDEELAASIRGPQLLVTDTVMRNDRDRVRLAEAVVAFGESLRP